MARLIGNVDATSSLTTNFILTTSISSDVELYLPFDTNTNDSGSNSHTITANGTAAVSATQSKFGGKSFYINALANFLSVDSSANFEFEENDFTIEMFIRPDTIDTSFSSAGYSAILDYDATTLNGAFFTLHQYNQALSWVKGTSVALTTSNCLSALTWHHIAVVRASNTLSIYCDGTSVGSVSDTNDYDDSATRSLYIGKQNISNNDRYFKGYIDDLRITKNQALYTANFTPATEALGLNHKTPQTNTRTFSSVWNLNSAVVTENFKAGTWPS